jgi:hypothetical protein
MGRLQLRPGRSNSRDRISTAFYTARLHGSPRWVPVAGGRHLFNEEGTPVGVCAILPRLKTQTFVANLSYTLYVPCSIIERDRLLSEQRDRESGGGDSR